MEAFVDHAIPLQFVAAGAWGTVSHVAGDASAVHRLNELGVRTGTRLRVLQSGTPCIVQLAGHKLAIRGEDGVAVFISPLGDAAAAVPC